MQTIHAGKKLPITSIAGAPLQPAHDRPIASTVRLFLVVFTLSPHALLTMSPAADFAANCQ
jgi:hypothetical protein